MVVLNAVTPSANRRMKRSGGVTHQRSSECVDASARVGTANSAATSAEKAQAEDAGGSCLHSLSLEMGVVLPVTFVGVGPLDHPLRGFGIVWIMWTYRKT